MCRGRSVGSIHFGKTPLAVQDDGKPVKFVAYYPYNADMQDFNYPVSIADQSNGSTACDLLYGTASEPYVYDKESDTNIALQIYTPSLKGGFEVHGYGKESP